MIWQSLNFVWVRDGVRSWEGDAFSYMNISPNETLSIDTKLRRLQVNCEVNVE